MTRARLNRPLSIFALLAPLAIAAPTSGAAESGFEGKYKIGVEVERKKCTSCSSAEYENEIDATFLDLRLTPKARKDLDFGLKFELESDNDGALLWGDRSNTVNNNGLTLWARKTFDNGFWARVQGTAESDDGLFDFGGRIGYETDLTEEASISGYVNLERRFPVGSGSSADRGTYLELNAEVEWDWESRGAWLEVEASNWFFDSGSVKDEQELEIQPGFWFALGETGHKGLFWLEGEHKRYKNIRTRGRIGAGVEFDLPNRSELLVGLTVGRELKKKPGKADTRMTMFGLEVVFQQRF